MPTAPAPHREGYPSASSPTPLTLATDGPQRREGYLSRYLPLSSGRRSGLCVPARDALLGEREEGARAQALGRLA